MKKINIKSRKTQLAVGSISILLLIGAAFATYAFINSNMLAREAREQAAAKLAMQEKGKDTLKQLGLLQQVTDLENALRDKEYSKIARQVEVATTLTISGPGSYNTYTPAQLESDDFYDEMALQMSDVLASDYETSYLPGERRNAGFLNRSSASTGVSIQYTYSHGTTLVAFYDKAVDSSWKLRYLDLAIVAP